MKQIKVMKKVYSLSDAAEVLGVTHTRLNTWVKDGVIPFTPTISGRTAMTKAQVCLAGLLLHLHEFHRISLAMGSIYIRLISDGIAENSKYLLFYHTDDGRTRCAHIVDSIYPDSTWIGAVIVDFEYVKNQIYARL